MGIPWQESAGVCSAVPNTTASPATTLPSQPRAKPWRGSTWPLVDVANSTSGASSVASKTNVRSKFMRLFDFDHLADARLVAHLQPIQIDSSGDGLALRVLAIPSQPVVARRQRTVPHVVHWLPQDIVDG